MDGKWKRKRNIVCQHDLNIDLANAFIHVHVLHDSTVQVV